MLEYEVKSGSYHIEVTEEDIRLGVPKDAFACPIALAMKRVFGFEVEADGPHFRFGVVEGRGPKKIDEFVSAFDLGFVVTPFEFDLALDYIDPTE